MHLETKVGVLKDHCAGSGSVAKLGSPMPCMMNMTGHRNGEAATSFFETQANFLSNCQKWWIVVWQNQQRVAYW